MSAVAVIIAAAATVVLIAVAASGIGPVRSLRRAVARFRELEEDAATLQRNVERVSGRAQELFTQRPEA